MGLLQSHDAVTVFKKFDTDGSGNIDASEFTAALLALGVVRTVVSGDVHVSMSCTVETPLALCIPIVQYRPGPALPSML